MGLSSPKHIEQVMQIKQSQQRLLRKIPIFRETGNHHTTNRMAKTIASQLPMHKKKAKPFALYGLSKVDINPSWIDIRPSIFRYGVS
jgi:hypothetical protein